MQKSGNFQKFRICLLFCLCALAASSVWAQPGGGFTADRMFSFYDRDGNGRLEGEEFDRIRGPLREILDEQGFDTRRGMGEREFSRAFDQMRERMDEMRSRGEGFGGRGFGDRGSSDRDSGDRGPGERSFGGRGFGDRSRSEGGQSPRTANAAPAPPQRVTVDLPASFSEGDLDGDGQIAFWEWRIWKRGSTAEFFAYDHNGDGFLTPQELVKGPREDLASSENVTSGAPLVSSNASANGATGVPASASAPMAQGASATESSTSRFTSSRTPTTTGGAAPTPVPATGGTPPPSGPVDLDSPAAKQAENLFRLLDKDRDGSLAGTEWNGSRRLKPLFENAGINLQESMSKENFIKHYVRLVSQ